MSGTDFVGCAVFSALAGIATYYHAYYLAVFLSLFFLSILASIVIFHIRNPQPRYFLGTEFLVIPENREDIEEKLQELKDKIKEEE